LEWRRHGHGWSEDDPRLVEDGTDAWLNGMDDLPSGRDLFRWVVKAGRRMPP